MIRVVIDAATIAKLKDFREMVELRDEQGACGATFFRGRRVTRMEISSSRFPTKNSIAVVKKEEDVLYERSSVTWKSYELCGGLGVVSRT